MGTSRLTAKGQITIPKALRERLGLRSGDAIEFIEVEGGLLVQKQQSASPFAQYRGYLRHLRGEDPDTLLEAMRGQ